MSKICHLIILLFFLLTLGLVRPRTIISNRSGISLNIDSIPRVDSLCLSKIFLKYKIIPLEILADNFTSDLVRVRIHNNMIYVADLAFQKSVDVYDLDGRFISRIKSVGRGPGEYLLPTDFDIDENGDVLILDWSSPIINRYDFRTGNYKKSFSTPDKRRFSSFSWFKGEILFFQPTPLSLDGDHYSLYVSDTLGKLKEKLLPTAEYSKGYTGSTSEGMGNFFRNKDELYIFSSVNETIYKYSKGKVNQYITLLSRKYQMTSKEIFQVTSNPYDRIRNKESEKLKGVDRFICNDKMAFIVYNLGTQNNILLMYNFVNKSIISGNLPTIINDLTITRNLHFQGLWDNKIISFTTPKTTDYILTKLYSGEIKLDTAEKESLIRSIERIKATGDGIPNHLVILYELQH